VKVPCGSTGLDSKSEQDNHESRARGATARWGLEEAIDKRCEATDRNHMKEA